jgi:hypothetical protein
MVPPNSSIFQRLLTEFGLSCWKGSCVLGSMEAEGMRNPCVAGIVAHVFSALQLRPCKSSMQVYYFVLWYNTHSPARFRFELEESVVFRMPQSCVSFENRRSITVGESSLYCNLSLRKRRNYGQLIYHCYSFTGLELWHKLGTGHLLENWVLIILSVYCVCICTNFYRKGGFNYAYFLLI